MRLNPASRRAGAQDHFFEGDTEAHAWESLAALLRSDATEEVCVDVGLPVTHGGVRYNCRAFLLRRRVLLLRPKLVLADDGNYREARWFTAWARPSCVETFRLPDCVAAVAGQATVPIGDAALAFQDTTLATELCEARWGALQPPGALAWLTPLIRRSFSCRPRRTRGWRCAAWRSSATAAAATTSCAS